jgi:hypothetical protein
MEAELTTWHFIAALAAFALFGAIGHAVRGLVNPVPDRLSDSPMLDMLISDGYSASDHFLGVEYDDFGYYRFDSLKNLKISVVLSIIGGALAIAFCEGADIQTAHYMNMAAEWVASLFEQRMAELGLG